MSAPRVAARYAEALFELARERHAVDGIRRELEQFAELLEGSPELRGLLERADLPTERKVEALGSALGGAFSDSVAALLAALVRHRRGDLAAQVLDAYGEFADRAAGVVRAEVCTVVPLRNDQRERLLAVLERIAGGEVRLAERVDPAVLAGVRLQVGDRLVDGSAAGRLARLREALLEERGQ